MIATMPPTFMMEQLRTHRELAPSVYKRAESEVAQLTILKEFIDRGWVYWYSHAISNRVRTRIIDLLYDKYEIHKLHNGNWNETMTQQGKQNTFNVWPFYHGLFGRTYALQYGLFSSDLVELRPMDLIIHIDRYEILPFEYQLEILRHVFAIRDRPLDVVFIVDIQYAQCVDKMRACFNVIKGRPRVFLRYKRDNRLYTTDQLHQFLGDLYYRFDQITAD